MPDKPDIFMNSLISVNLFQTEKLCVKDLVKEGNQLTWKQLFELCLVFFDVQKIRYKLNS